MLDLTETPCVSARMLMELGYLKGVVIAGHGGLDRRIKRVAVLSTPTPDRWLKGGELLLTTGYVFSGTESLSRAVEVFIEKDVAALGFKEGPYLSDPGSDILAMANRANFPIIRIPAEESVADLVERVYSLILSTWEQMRFRTLGQSYRIRDATFFRDVFSGKYNVSELVTLAVAFGVAVNPNYCLYGVRPGEPYMMPNIMRALQSPLSSLGHTVCIVPYGSIIAVIWPNTNQPTMLDVSSQIRLITTVLKAHEFESALPIAALAEPVTLEQLGEGFQKINIALELRDLSNGNSTVMRFEDLGLLGMLARSLSTKELREFCLSKIGALISHDRGKEGSLLKSLEVYLENDCSVNQAAQAMFVHPSTLKHRLKRINEMLPRPCRGVREKSEIYVAIRVHRMLDLIGRNPP